MNKLTHYLRLAKKQAKLPEYNSFIKQVFDMSVVFLYCRIGPGYFQIAEMGKKKYDWKYKLGFLNGKKYIARVDIINVSSSYIITFNKVVEKSLFTLFSIPTPKALGFLHSDRGHAFGATDLKSFDDFALLCQKHIDQKICIKLVSGFGGEGFRLVQICQKPSGLFLFCLKEQKEFPIEKYYEQLNLEETDGFLIEEHFEQHASLSKLNRTSLNTLRIMVYKPKNQPAKCLGVFLKMGRKGSVVDNGAAGGIIAKVNMKSGVLEAGMVVSSRNVVFTHHPDSLETIEGTSVPFLKEAIDLAKKSIEPFSGIRHVGADVAIGQNGPVVIELNARADYVDYAILNVPSKIALSKQPLIP